MLWASFLEYISYLIEVPNISIELLKLDYEARTIMQSISRLSRLGANAYRFASISGKRQSEFSHKQSQAQQHSPIHGFTNSEAPKCWE